MTAVGRTSAASPATRAVNLPVREDVRDLIDQAAQAHGKTRSEFMIEASRRAAEDALLDQTFFSVQATTYAEYLKVLDRARLKAQPTTG